MLKKSALALAAATLLIAGCSNDDNPAIVDFTAYATDGASIFTFNPRTALEISEATITGLNSGTLLYAIDYNPNGGVLNGIGSDGQSYKIDPVTGVAEVKGTRESTVTLTNKAVEIDYNPTVASRQVYRVSTSTNGENFRHNDTTGDISGNDTAFAYRAGDPVNNGKSVVVSGIAYTNSQVAAAVPSQTTVFAIDSQNDMLTRLGNDPANGTAGDAGNPNSGQLTTIGSLGVNVTGFVGFDILSNGTAASSNDDFGYVTAEQNGTYNLYSINLGNGAMTFITGLNPKIRPVRSFAVRQPQP